MVPRLAVVLWVSCVVAALPTLVLLAIGPGRVLPSDIFSGLGGASFLVLALTFGSVGVVVALRVPGNSIGLVFCVTGFATVVQLLTWQYADLGLHRTDRLPAAAAATTVNTMVGEATAGLLALSLLVFPDGRLPSRRWRLALASVLTGMVLLVVAGTFRPGRYDQPFAAASNPFGIAGAGAAIRAVEVIGWLFVLAGIASAAAALVVRLRRAEGVERQRLKLVLTVGAAAGVAAALLMPTWLVWPHGHLQLRIAALGLLFTTFPIAAGVAILRHRLFDIDFVINRTIVYSAVTLVLAAVFTATNLLLGIALGRGSAWATGAATLVVAVAFRPLRARMQDVVDRRFNRARYDALRQTADFLELLRAGRAAPEEFERFLRELLADPRLEILFFLSETELYVDSRGVSATEAPHDGREQIPIERDGQPLGLVLHDAATEERRTLLRRVVEAGGLALEIARLRVELRRQLAEVEYSRARIVTAANEERRRIERDLHDGAQQRLVSIGLALRHAQYELAADSPERADETLDAAVAEVEIAIEELRELARGLPPAQLDGGLAPAFHELASRTPVPVKVNACSERLDRGIEAAAYFIGCEAVTNAVKHAHATSILLTAERQNERLIVAVVDDGIGGARPAVGSGLSGLFDRVAALGGTLRLESEDGAGTTLVAELPCAS